MHETTPATTRTIRRGELRGRGIGMIVGAGFGGWWAVAALHAAPAFRTWPIEAAVALVTGILVVAGAATFWRGVRAAPIRHEVTRPRHRKWWKFLPVLVIEIVALNLVVAALQRNGLMSYLLPAIAIIVGLHFYPLARIFRAPFLHITATLMALAGVAAVLAILSGQPPARVNAMVAAISALTLWVTVAVDWLRLRSAHAVPHVDATAANVGHPR